MMIDVGNGISVSSEHIESVESLDDLNCVINCSSKSYTIAMPRGLVVSMIERDSEENPMSNVEKLLHQLYQSQVTPRP